MAQSSQKPALYYKYRRFDFCLITWAAWPCRKHRGAVIGRHFTIGAVNHRVVEAGLDDRDLGIVRVLCPPRLCGKPLRIAVAVTATGHISIKGQRATRATLVRSAKLVFGEVPPKRSKGAGTPPMLPASS